MMASSLLLKALLQAILAYSKRQMCQMYFVSLSFERNDLTSNNMHLVEPGGVSADRRAGKELEFATMVHENNNYYSDLEVTYVDTEGVQIFSYKVHRIILVSSG